MLIVCGGCRKKLNVENNLSGQLGRCPACNSVIKIPSVQEVLSRLPGEPPPVAAVAPDPELTSGGAGPQLGPSSAQMTPAGASTHSPAPGEDSSTAEASSRGIQTDEQGFVLAIPVEDEVTGQPAVSSPGLPVGSARGSSVGEADRGGGDLGYALADEQGPPMSMRSGGAPADSATHQTDLSESLDHILDRLKASETPAPAQTGMPTSDRPSLSTGVSRGAPEEKIITRCPGCGGRLAIEAQYAGKMRTCPGCATEIQVPVQSTVASPAMFRAPSSTGRKGAGRTSAPTAEEEFSPEVDLESLTGEPSMAGSRGVAGFWVAVALIVGLAVGFAAGILTGKFLSKSARGTAEPAPVQLESDRQGQS
jgi:hypothetical protein